MHVDGDALESGVETHCGLILALTITGLAVADYRDMVHLSQHAENYGFDSVWLCDHFLTLSPDEYVKDAGITSGDAAQTPARPSPLPLPLLEVWTTLAALSRDTSTLRLGTSVLCTSYRYPSVLAKMAATLDVISGGRLELGLGAGWFQREYEAYGIPFPPVGDRVGAFKESIDVLKAVWTQDYPTYRGRYYTLDGAICNPLPVQQPHPPLWVGGEGDRVQRIGVRAAEGLNIRWWSPERIDARKDFLTKACDSVGRDPATLRLSVTALLAPTESPEHTLRMRREFASIPESGMILGSPEQCVDRIEQYKRAGVSHFLFAIPHITTSEFLHIAGEQILPAVKLPG